MRRWRTWLLVALLAWILVVAWWATQPITDAVPTGVVNNESTSQAVQCDSPLSGNTKPTAPLPALHGRRSYQRTPCATAIRNGRLIFWIDLILVLVALAVLAKTWRPAAAPTSLDDVSLA